MNGIFNISITDLKKIHLFLTLTKRIQRIPIMATINYINYNVVNKLLLNKDK